MMRYLSLLALLTLTSATTAAPAPLPKAERRLPPLATIVERLKAKGIEVQQITRGEQGWVIGYTQPVTYSSLLIGDQSPPRVGRVNVTHTVRHAPDQRVALWQVLQWIEELDRERTR